MNTKQITGIYFSPTGHSGQAVRAVLSRFNENQDILDLTDPGKRPDYYFHENEAVVVGVPVYGGRIPDTAIQRFRRLHGNQTPAVLIVTYGNRDYEDALLELKEVLSCQGFRPFAAAAVVAEHNIVPAYGTGRPDQADLDKLYRFADQAAQKLSEASCNFELGDVNVKGNHPYRPYPGFHLKIRVSSTCNGCGTCIKSCPVQAISRTDPRVMDEERCITCMRCIKVCPVQGRNVSRLMLLAVRQKLKKVCSGRKEPEFFL